MTIILNAMATTKHCLENIRHILGSKNETEAAITSLNICFERNSHEFYFFYFGLEC